MAISEEYKITVSHHESGETDVRVDGIGNTPQEMAAAANALRKIADILDQSISGALRVN